MKTASVALVVVVFLAGCGHDQAQAPQGPSPEGQSNADAGNPTDGRTSAFDAATRPRPTRLVVLGDSIAACLGVGDRDGADCGPHKLHAYLDGGAARGLSYENLAVSGAEAADVPTQQLPRVRPGPGHVLVLVYVGGNDLRPYMIASDRAAEAGFATVTNDVSAAWAKIFAFFADRGRFPDGATLLMNNQYDPFDGCTAPPFFVSARKAALLSTYNQLLAQLARDNGATLTDQHGPFLGHGHHHAVPSCPHYQKGLQAFMGDLIHPNVAGHDNLFTQWRTQVDGFYGSR
jgi:lysophospholipase L1-like esterase